MLILIACLKTLVKMKGKINFVTLTSSWRLFVVDATLVDLMFE